MDTNQVKKSIKSSEPNTLAIFVAALVLRAVSPKDSVSMQARAH